uniref:Ig-like domain-containing protein n=1 Tax=Equus caballus TaxID=9796 RepID=F6UGG2_HORSE
MFATLTALLCLASYFPPGTLPKPTIWAEPGSVISRGKPVAICGQGTLEAKEYLVYGEGSSVPWDRQQPLKPKAKVRFSIPYREERHAGRHRCYYLSPTGWSEHSDALELVLTDESVSGKPSLLSQQGSIMTFGQNLTLQCLSDISYDRFALSKEGGHNLPQRLSERPQTGCSQADFLLGRVSLSHGGRYRCYGGHKFSSKWSTPSDPLDILVAGVLPDTPSLSVQPGPTVAAGENVTLLCQTRSQRDILFLSKEGTMVSPLRLRSKYQAQQYQAQFSMSPVTSAHGGTYRCYSSFSTSPYKLSHPSDALELMVSGERCSSKWQQWLNHDITGVQGLKPYQNVLIGISVAFVLLLFLFVLLLIRHRQQGKCRTSDRWVPSSPGRQAAPTPTTYLYPDSPLIQAAASDAPQDVIYAQLNHLTLGRKTMPPSSQSEEPPAEPSVYSALAIH